MNNEDNKSTTEASGERPLSALHIGNFKAFADTQRVLIKPLTLIFGANSSGKSSIIHSLLLARHAVENGNLDVYQTKVGGESVDLGGFRQYIHRHDLKRRLELGFEIEIGNSADFARFFGEARRLTAKFQIGLEDGSQQEFPSAGRPCVLDFQVDLDGGCLVQFTRQSQKGLPIRSIGLGTLLRTKAKKPVFGILPDFLDSAFLDPEFRLDEDGEASRTRLEKEVWPKIITKLSQTQFNTDHLVPENPATSLDRLVARRIEESSIDEEEHGFALHEYLPKERTEGGAKSEVVHLRWGIEDLLDLISQKILTHLQGLNYYLGPLRCFPPRHLTGMQDQDPNWFSGGGQAWELIRERSEVRRAVNSWLTRLKMPYHLDVRELVNPKTPDSVVLRELILQDDQGTALSDRDVGLGVSQVIPVIANAFAVQKQIIAIEQPEAQLHPAAQAELGDVFIESALGEQKNTFILETHSEHLILRIMRRMRETYQKKLPDGLPPVLPEEVAILYVELDGSRSIVREMPLNEMGQLVKAWPGGFFEEGFRELFS